MLPGAYFGKATNVRATGYTAITSAAAAVIGVMSHSTGTSLMSFYNAVSATGSSTIGGLIRFFVTAAAATGNPVLYYPFPADAPSGFHVNIGASADPNITIFWNPVGGP